MNGRNESVGAQDGCRGEWGNKGILAEFEEAVEVRFGKAARCESCKKERSCG